MKKNNIILVLSIAVAVFASGCRKGGLCVRGAGPVVSETRSLASFDKITLDGSADIYIAQDSVQSVTVQAQDNILDILETEVYNGHLKIGFDRNCVKNHEPVKVYLTVPNIWEVRVEGSGNIIGLGSINMSDLRFEIEGSGNIQFPLISANSLGVHISGSGDVNFAGEGASYLDIDINGSGNVRAYDLPVNNVAIDVDGSGDSRVHAIDNLDVRISGSGNVYYLGYPQITSHISGSGDIISAN